MGVKVAKDAIDLASSHQQTAEAHALTSMRDVLGFAVIAHNPSISLTYRLY